MTRLSDCIAVVTGRKRVARELAAQGSKVYITGRTPDDLRHIDGLGTAISCDHRIDHDVAAAFDRIVAEAGRIDLLVNNVWARDWSEPRRSWKRPPGST